MEKTGVANPGTEEREDQDSQVWSDRDFGGTGLPALRGEWEIPFTNLKFNRSGFLSPIVPRKGHRDQELCRFKAQLARHELATAKLLQ